LTIQHGIFIKKIVNKPSSLEELSPKTTDNQRRFSMVAEVKQATPATVQKSVVPKDM
jgi:hypothetical protein